MSLNDKLEAFFRRHRWQWIDGRRLAQIAGYAGYRNRITDLRLERGLPIVNRPRTVRYRGKTYKKSEYRLTRKKAA